MALAVTLAVGIALGDALPALAGTVVRGRLKIPASAEFKDAGGKDSREPLDARDAVVYVTEASNGKGSRLGGRPGRKEIELAGDRFTPRVLPVMVGAKVRFRNRDRVYHGLFSVSPAGRSDLGNLAPGQRRETRFNRTGVSNLFCELHPAAAGFVVVCPNWYFTRPVASGEFVLPPLPRGRYVVNAWHPRLGATRRSVEVTGSGALDLVMGY